MSTSQFISVRESAQILGVSEKKIMDLVEEQKLQAYRIADQFLRLKKEEVLILKNAGKIVSENKVQPYSFQEKIMDYFYFNDFYLISIVIMGFLLYLIFQL